MIEPRRGPGPKCRRRRQARLAMKNHRLSGHALFRQVMWSESQKARDDIARYREEKIQASDLDAGHLHKALAAMKRCLYLRQGGREAFFHAMRSSVRYYLIWAAHWRQKAGRVLPC